jgi:hypothetical protein
MTGYRILLDAHSYCRWIVVAAALVALAGSVATWMGRRAWSPSNERWAKLFLGALDLQLTIGVVLWLGFSPFWKGMMSRPHDAMKNHLVRFWSVEHTTLMLLAVVVAHVGRVMSKRREPARRAQTFALTLFVWFVLVLLVFPWPGLTYGRVLLRAP